MAGYIALFLGDFPGIMTAFALFLGIIRCLAAKHRASADIFLGSLFFFAVGLSGLWGFIYHVFFPNLAAQYIGWQPSPFQFEVGVANLGLGVVGIFGLHATKGYRIAGALFTACLLWGAAYGHIVQMIHAHNFAPGNAGVIFYNDLVLPLLLVIFLLAWREASV